MTEADIKNRAMAIAQRAMAIAQDMSDDHTDDDDIARAVRDICKLVAEAVSEVKVAGATGGPDDCLPPDPEHLAARGVRKRRGEKA